ETSNSADILRWDMGVMFAKNYVRQLSDNVKRSFEQKRIDGEWHGSAPYGYKNTRKDGKSWLQPNVETARQVIAMYTWYSTESYSMKEIRKKLIEEFSITMPVSQVDRILKRKFYYGDM